MILQIKKKMTIYSLFLFSTVLFFLSVFCADINITNCTQLDNITSSNNYFLMQDLDCPSLTNSVVFSNGVFGKKNIKLINSLFT